MAEKIQQCHIDAAKAIYKARNLAIIDDAQIIADHCPAPAPGKPTKLEVPIQLGEFSRESPLVDAAPTPAKCPRCKSPKKDNRWPTLGDEPYPEWDGPNEFWEVYHDDDCDGVITPYPENLCLKCGMHPDLQSRGARQTRGNPCTHSWHDSPAPASTPAQPNSFLPSMMQEEINSAHREIERLREELAKAAAISKNTQSSSPLCYCGNLPRGKKCLACQLAALASDQVATTDSTPVKSAEKGT